MLPQIPETNYPELICMFLYNIMCAMEKPLGEGRSVQLLLSCVIQFSKPIKTNQCNN